MRRESAEIKTDWENREVEGFSGMLKKKGCYADFDHQDIFKLHKTAIELRKQNVKVRDAED